MKTLIVTFPCVFALLASTIVMAEQPPKEPVAGRDQPALMSEPARIMPDQTETPRMKAWCDLHYGLFLHFNINTFIEKSEHGHAKLTAKLYAPSALDVDGWVRIAKDAGMKYAVLTAKHRYGFCLWDSKVLWHGKEFDYDVAASGNTTDVVQAFMDACKQYGIVPGLYYNLRDAHAAPEQFSGNQGHLSKDYFDLVKSHLTELTTRYPECHYYWIDHPSAAATDQLADIYELLRRADPSGSQADVPVVRDFRETCRRWGTGSFLICNGIAEKPEESRRIFRFCANHVTNCPQPVQLGRVECGFLSVGWG